MAVSKKKRFDVFKRDGFACRYCGHKPPEAVLEVDHVHPVSKGGNDETTNLITSCFDCNRGKAAGLLSEIPPTLAGEMERRKEAAEQVKEYNRFLKKLRKDEDAAILRIAESWDSMTWRASGIEVDTRDFSNDCKRSIRTFLRRLPEMEVVDAIEIAVAKKGFNPEVGDTQLWKYFCGICWSKIKEG